MGRDWDHGVPGIKYWETIMAAMKPGAHLLAFGGTRTYHRLTCAIEDAGFEIRDCIMWVYGSGFPKSTNISKNIDKMKGAERKIISSKKTNSGGFAHISKTNAEQGFRPSAYKGHSLDDDAKNVIEITEPATDEAKQWDGWGTALKPAWEPIVVARKPFKGTVASNVLEHGTGGLNIGGCRVETSDNLNGGAYSENGNRKDIPGTNRSTSAAGMLAEGKTVGSEFEQPIGRFPANLIHDDSDEVVKLFPDSKGQQGEIKGSEPSKPGKNTYGDYTSRGKTSKRDDIGSAARFFYCAKTSKSDRGDDNTHPTVKPTTLMQYLCRLITPPGGTILDPYMGTGSTGKAALKEGFKFIGIDNNDEKNSFETACKRIWKIQQQGDLFQQVGNS